MDKKCSFDTKKASDAKLIAFEAFNAKLKIINAGSDVHPAEGKEW
jgi:hypothetical protein